MKKTKLSLFLIVCFGLGLALPVRTQVFVPEGKQACFWDLGIPSDGGYYHCSRSGICDWRDNYYPTTMPANCPDEPH